MKDVDRPLDWLCALGHHFGMTPKRFLRGGHCMTGPAHYPDVTRASRFFVQASIGGRG